MYREKLFDETEQQQLAIANNEFINNNSVISNLTKPNLFLEAILSTEFWEIQSESGSGHIPPDFISKDKSMMMDIMKIDDRSTKKSNQMLRAERNVLNGVVNQFTPDLKDELQTLDTNQDGYILSDIGFKFMPTYHSVTQEASYEKYLKNSKRIINKHLQSINLYRENFPNRKLIFFIYDESVSYFETNTKVKQPSEEGSYFYIEPNNFKFWHQPGRDVNLIDDILKSDVDYLVWFGCHKNVIDLPNDDDISHPIKFEVYDLKNLYNEDLIQYNPNNFIKLEK